jgi:hypothetical protein
MFESIGFHPQRRGLIQLDCICLQKVSEVGLESQGYPFLIGAPGSHRILVRISGTDDSEAWSHRI